MSISRRALIAAILATAIGHEPAPAKKRRKNKRQPARWRKRSVVVIDRTDSMGEYVARTVAKWNDALPGRLTLVYQRGDPAVDCAGVVYQPGSIVVCNEYSRGQDHFGLADITVQGKRILGAVVHLLGARYDEGQYVSGGWPFGCHEIGHALGLSHNDSDESCMNSERDTPGAADIAKLRHIYGKRR